MGTQVSHGQMPPGEQAPVPVEEQQRLTEDEDRRRMILQVRLLGVEVAVISGFLLALLLSWFFLSISLAVFGVFVAALLFRSWWALLVVSAAFVVGMMLGAVLIPFVQAGWPALQDQMADGFVPLMPIFGMFGLWLVLLSAAVGTALSIRLGKVNWRKLLHSKRERAALADTTARGTSSPPSAPVSQAESPLPAAPPPSPPPVQRHAPWRLGMLLIALLMVGMPLATVASTWEFILPPPKPADCGQPVDEARSGAITQFCFLYLTPLLRQHSMTAGSDGNMWFTEGQRIGRITPAGVLTEFHVSAPYLYIVAGPDGNLWFPADPGIIRISPHGDLKEFALAQSPHATPLTGGPDGNLWFPEGQVLTKMTLTGQITQFSLPFEVRELAPASDGNLWFVGDGMIGRISLNGVVVSRYATATDKMAAFTPGPDGNLWFSEEDGHVGRITLTGEVKRFSAFIPTYQEFHLIIAGPDGNLWYSAGIGEIGRITPSGKVTLLPLPPTAEISAMAAGADGGIWFIRSDPSAWTRIGRITP